MTEYTPFARNETNQNSKGGTELAVEGVQRAVESSSLLKGNLDKFQFIASRVREIHEDKIRILHLHDLAVDPESKHLENANLRNRFHKLVFVSNWQANQYRDYLGVPFDVKSTVIENGIDSFKMAIKPKDFSGPIRLIYASTPHRGLALLVPVFIELAKHNPNIVLDVYSSFELYGWSDRDKEYEALYQACRDHPKINYHGSVDNKTVRKAMVDAHILAYPSIWQETSCRVLIEAMMAGCLCVHPNLAALADTAGGQTLMYDFDMDPNVHASLFYSTLGHAINIVQQAQGHLEFVQQYAERRFSWEVIGPKWEGLFLSLLEEYKDKSLAPPSQMFSYKTA